MCEFWETIKMTLKPDDILYTTGNYLHFRFVAFKLNRVNEEVLQFSIPKRNEIGCNYKSISKNVLCKAKYYYDKGTPVNAKWVKSNFPSVLISGGCNVKVIQGILLKVHY